MRSQKSDDDDDTERWTWPVAWKLPLGSLGVFHGLRSTNTINCQPIITREILDDEAPCSHQRKTVVTTFKFCFQPYGCLITLRNSPNAGHGKYQIKQTI